MQYWEILLRDRFRFKHAPDAVGDGTVVAKFFPRLLGRDPVKKMLERVSCQLPDSRVRVSAAQFTRAGVASRLRDLAKQGCDVKVITRFDGRLHSPTKSAQRKLGRNMVILPFDGKTPDLKSTNSIHTKMMMIDASVDGSSEKRAFVLTGSHNLDFFSLHTNDETMLIIEDRRVYEAYFDFWNRLLNEAQTSGIKLTYGDGSTEVPEKGTFEAPGSL
jgi:phosphatidylserine/phosphatidylglycerophosphate/cardiolipin synthase-like enzyme